MKRLHIVKTTMYIFSVLCLQKNTQNYSSSVKNYVRVQNEK